MGTTEARLGQHDTEFTLHRDKSRDKQIDKVELLQHAHFTRFSVGQGLLLDTWDFFKIRDNRTGTSHFHKVDFYEDWSTWGTHAFKSGGWQGQVIFTSWDI